MKTLIDKIPLIGSIRRTRRENVPFDGSERYWEQRYDAGGNSGDGSYHLLAQFKAEVLNQFVDKHQVQSVMEYGCGDGNQLTLAEYPHYIGFDVSATAVNLCQEQFGDDRTKSFYTMNQYANQRAELTLSLDVIYHLVEDDVFTDYMDRLFASSDRFVIIYASNTEDNSQPKPAAHVRHREFTRWVEQNAPQWRLLENIPNRFPYSAETNTGSFADFYIFGKS